MFRLVLIAGLVGLSAAWTIPNYKLDGPMIPDGEEEPDHWINLGEEALRARLKMKPNERVARNVILFIGDGMGISTVTAGRWLRGQVNGRPGEENVLNFEKFPNVAFSKTYNVDRQSGDSGACATAIMSGVKGNFYQVGLNPRVQTDDCEGSLDNQVTTILDWYQELGRGTGIVTTSRITHATPASAYGHVANRYWDGDVNTKNVVDKGCKDLARQLVEDNPDISVIFGGGRRFFLLNDTADPETGTIDRRHRQDGRDLIKMWEDDKKNRNFTYKYAWNKDGFDEIDPRFHDFAMGLFEPNHMHYEIDRDKSGPTGEPSLAEMTRKAIQILKQKEKGFFLMVEGARIDHAHHDGMPIKALTDFLAFEDAIQEALDLTDESETLIVVTADHGQPMDIQSYAYRGSDIFGEMLPVDPGETLTTDGKSYAILGYSNGPGFKSPRDQLDLTKTHDKNFIWPSGIPLPYSTHDGEDVGIWAQGPMSHLIHGTQEQSYIAHVMAYSACVGRYRGNCRRPTENAETCAAASGPMGSVVLLVGFVLASLLK